MPKWEDELRREYIEAAKADIIREITERINTLNNTVSGNVNDVAVINYLNTNFPDNTWWGKYARKLFYEWHRLTLHQI